MVLTDCYLFPGCILPLYIFEERYRQMLAHALDEDRMFCIGSRRPGSCSCEPGELWPVSTAGMIRACVKQDDGTSHLMLYGLTRIRFTGVVQRAPFIISSVEPLVSEPADPQKMASLRTQALNLLAPAGPETGDPLCGFREAVQSVEDPAMLCDVLAYHLVKRPAALRSLLSEPSLVKRYSLLLAELERQGAG